MFFQSFIIYCIILKKSRQLQQKDVLYTLKHPIRHGFLMKEIEPLDQIRIKFSRFPVFILGFHFCTLQKDRDEIGAFLIRPGRYKGLENTDKICYCQILVVFDDNGMQFLK